MNTGKNMNSGRKEKLQILLKTAASAGDMDQGRQETSGFLYQEYSLDTQRGRSFYRGLEDDLLLKVLRERARELDHSPSQKEVFWVLREYIRKRFRRWPYALEAAGLKRSSGSGGKSWNEIEEEKRQYRALLGQLRYAAKELCRIPHPSDVPELCEKLKKYEKEWGTVVQAAGLDTEFFEKNAVYLVEDLDETSRNYLREIRRKAEETGRPPRKSEVPGKVQEVLIASCKSWRNALYQVGLEPVVRIRPFSSTYIDYRNDSGSRYHSRTLYDCCYRLVNPDETTVSDLQKLQMIRDQLGRDPEKKEVPKELWKRLQKVCGSWTNVLYQLKRSANGGKLSLDNVCPFH